MRFLLSSVFLLEAGSCLSDLSPDGAVEGSIIGFSDSGAEAKAFAVVEVMRKITVVVPAGSLTLVNTEF